MDQQKVLGQYPTPVWVAEALVERHFNWLSAADVVVEPSCGPGAFLGAVPSFVRAIGVEVDPLMVQLARMHTGREVIEGDFRTVPLDVKPTAIVGNPPFDLRLIDAFLDRAHALLPMGGCVGFLLPAYAFQTAARVAGYADRWSLMQEMIPRNIFQGLRLPLVFAKFVKERHRTLVGFALYREATDVQQLPRAYREIVSAGSGSLWERVVAFALTRLGGEASLGEIYTEIEGARPTQTKFWREQIRKVVRTSKRFACVGAARYALRSQDRGLAAPLQPNLCY